jgi:hypothetical protein
VVTDWKKHGKMFMGNPNQNHLEMKWIEMVFTRFTSWIYDDFWGILGDFQ